MQVKKEAVRREMIASARKEFLKYGFTGASMHRIAADSGIAVGNIYRYYNNKLDLFSAVVKPAYDDLLGAVLLKKSADNSDKIIPTAGNITKLFVEQMAELIRIMIEQRTELLILIDHSADTKFVNSKGALAGAITHQLKDALRIVSGINKKNIDGKILRAFSVGLIEGLLDIVRHYKSPRAIQQTAEQYIGVFAGGLNSIFK